MLLYCIVCGLGIRGPEIHTVRKKKGDVITTTPALNNKSSSIAALIKHFGESSTESMPLFYTVLERVRQWNYSILLRNIGGLGFGCWALTNYLYGVQMLMLYDRLCF